MTGSILWEALIFLGVAIICVPIAKRIGLSSIIGYLLGGILIGPFVLDFVGEKGADILHFAEFGVVMMLFLIGLEIDPKSFWRLRKAILGMGGLQVLATMVLSYLFFMSLNYTWEVSLTFAMVMALSSTAITLQTLKENGKFKTTYGMSSFSILLFQDIIVIVMLGVLPLLGSGAAASGHHEESFVQHFLSGLPMVWQTIFIIFSVLFIVVAGRYLFVPLLRRSATTGVREMLTATALLIVIGIAYLMEQVGLSPALGAFLGGVVLANSEFKHELESTLEPFKDLLLGLFFMAVGASINFLIIKEEPLLISLVLLASFVIKGIVLYGVGTVFKLNVDQRLLLTVGLAQIGEFAFVLLSFAAQWQILDQAQMGMMLVITALTMAISPIFNIILERWILPHVGTKRSTAKPLDTIEEENKVIIVGFGHFGSTIGRFLRSHGVEATILDHDSERVDFLRKLGFKVYYGDATRMELLESAGIATADILITAIDNPEITLDVVRKVRHKYPEVEVMVRAKNRYDAFELINEGVDQIYRESLDTSVKMAGDALHKLGFRKYTIHRQAQKFIKSDEEGIRRLAGQTKNTEEYISRTREEIEQQEKWLESQLKAKPVNKDEHWDSTRMRGIADSA